MTTEAEAMKDAEITGLRHALAWALAQAEDMENLAHQCTLANRLLAERLLSTEVELSLVKDGAESLRADVAYWRQLAVALSTTPNGDTP